MSGNFALVVDRRGAELKLGRHHSLTVVHADGRTENVGLAALGVVVLHGDIRLGTRTLQALSQAGIALCILPGKDYEQHVSFSAAPSTQVRLRHRQHLAYACGEQRLRLARAIVVTKCEAMAQFANSYGPPGDAIALQAISTAGMSANANALRGIEGACTAHHFSLLAAAYGRTAPFSFHGRSRQPPRDAANALMSLGYRLAEAEATRLLLHVGLDTQLGFLHELSPGRESLALDLIEPARAIIDEWVFQLLNGYHIIKPSMFEDSTERPSYLNGDGRKAYYGAWFAEGRVRVLKPMRRLLATLIRVINLDTQVPDAPSGNSPAA